MVWMMKYSNKYYNIKTKTSDGNIFDSSKEARRWEDLLILQKIGKITELQRQVPYELLPNQYETYERFSKKGERLKDGQRLVERKVVYVADFVYHDVKTGELIVEDTKSEATRTKDYILKRKLMYLVHGIRIKEV
jgi:hypothetical protein